VKTRQAVAEVVTNPTQVASKKSQRQKNLIRAAEAVDI
jgi:hypothetical protein